MFISWWMDREYPGLDTWLLHGLCSVPHTAVRRNNLKLLKVQMPSVHPRTIKSTSRGSSQASVIYDNPWLIPWHKLRTAVPKRQPCGSLEIWWGKLRHCCPFRWETACEDPFPKAKLFVNLPVTWTSETNRNLFLLSVFSYQLLHNVSSKIFLIMSWWLNYNSSIRLKGKLNFSTNWEDLFIFFWMTRYWVDTYKMKDS